MKDLDNVKKDKLRNSGNEVNLILVLKALLDNRKFILKTIIVFLFVGLFIAFFSEKEYSASSTIVPQTSSGKSLGGGIGSLAAIAGINLGSLNNDSEISPTLYSKIVNSIPFQKELLETPLSFIGYKEQITYKRYFDEIYTPGLLSVIKKYTIGLPSLVIKSLKQTTSISETNITNKKLSFVSEKEKELIERLSDQIQIEVNDKEGFVEIKAKMIEAIASAELAIRTQQLLQQYIIKFKTEKSLDKLRFIKKRFSEKESDFVEIQNKLAKYRDQNQNMNSELSKTKLQVLESQYDLTYSVFLELAKQVEAQQIKVKEDTPIFSILKPVSVPYQRLNPKRALILIVWTLLGFVLSIGFVFAKEPVRVILREINFKDESYIDENI